MIDRADVYNTYSLFKRWVIKRRLSLSILLAVILFLHVFFLGGPIQFSDQVYVEIPEGVSVSEAVEILKNEHIIKSESATTLLVLLYGGSSGVLAGEYRFDHPQSAFTIADRVTSGKYGVELVRVTLPEGAASYEMGAILEEVFVRIDADTFARKARKYEGRLFPDTYLFLPTANEDTVIEELLQTHDEQIATLLPEIEAFGASVEEVLVMASLLEREARTMETRRTIAGILWSRLDIDMPLQVDAVFGYIKSTNTFNPTFDDLEIESPYNTYLNRGLPPGPIGNPGLNSIRAAITPIETPYLYYLTGKDGVMRYSATFEGHVQNRRLYLD